MKTVRIAKVSLYLLICKSANTNFKANRERNRIVDNTKPKQKETIPKPNLRKKKKTRKKRNPAI